jgi:hypothetical protein
MTLRQAADALGCRVKTVRNLLSAHRDLFDAPRYRQERHGFVRVIEPAELGVLARVLAEKRQAWPRGVSSHSPARMLPSVPT